MERVLKVVKSPVQVFKKDRTATNAEKVIKPNIGISDKHREAVIQILNTVLSDEFVLYTKTRNFHWNVTGPQFNDLHKFFDEQYQALNETVDEVAERTRALGGRALGTLAEFLREARLKEHPKPNIDAYEMISLLVNDHEMLIRHLRDDADE